MPVVHAVVVTYNRRALLEECLAALAAQTRPPDRIMVVDNASTDGTADMVRSEHPEVELLGLETNVGSSGGFHEGLRIGHERGADWIWLMDDDLLPEPGALEALLEGERALEGRPPPLLLCSKVVWTDGRLHPMNEAKLKQEREAFVESCALGLLPIRHATFASLLVHRRAVTAYGLPLEHFFIWSDDIEFTGRILKDGPHGYLVPGSVAVHKTKNPHTAVSEGGPRFYFHVRNITYMLRGSAWTPLEKVPLVWTLVSTIAEYLRRARFGRDSVAVVLRGLRDGVKPVPAPSLPQPGGETGH